MQLRLSMLVGLCVEGRRREGAEVGAGHCEVRYLEPCVVRRDGWRD